MISSQGKTWRATAAIFYEQYGERFGHYWACCRTQNDKSWYKYNDKNTGDKMKKLPEGLPNIYTIIYQAVDGSDDDVQQHAEREMDWEYVERILADEANCISANAPKSKHLYNAKMLIRCEL